jgi:uncharacterized protein
MSALRLTRSPHFFAALLHVVCTFAYTHAAPEPSPSLKLVQAARAQVGVTLSYDPSYRKLDYPGGDVAASTGVCTDVLIRALRALQIDLQVRVHEDMRAHFARYPKLWGLSRPDKNIDHRRVPNLQRYFSRHGWSISRQADGLEVQAQPGDVLSWMLPGNLAHIGIVSDRRSPDSGRYLIIHNIGFGTQEEDVMLQWPLTGHYRMPSP